jgi:tryptophan-rich sensory protein
MIVLMPRSWIKLIASILVSQFAGFIGSIFTFSAITGWYQYINKPFFSPPNWIFGPVWTTLYTLMGISLYLNWIKLSNKKFAKQKAYIQNSIIIFLVHLVVNSVWSIIFFSFKDLLGALVVVVILWSMILWMIIRFRKTDLWASYLLIPYLAWVSFASLLNFTLWLIN